MNIFTKMLKVMINRGKPVFIPVIMGLCAFTVACSQQKDEVTDIFLTGTGKYAEISVKNTYNGKYPPANLFDTRFNTCWVSGPAKNEEHPSIFVKLPDRDDISVNIFPGYGKSKKLFKENARPKKLVFSIFAAVNPDGYVTEKGAQYKTREAKQKQIVVVEDAYGVQSFPLTFNKQKLSELKAGLFKYYHEHFETPVADTCLILKIEIAETYPGTKYDDVCLSELFFNDRFMTRNSGSLPVIEKIYLNEDENALLADIDNEKGILIYSDTTSVLQVTEQSDDKKWAVLISMPAETDGRAETTYLLVDLYNRSVVNEQLAKCTGYPAGSELFFEKGNDHEQYVVFSTPDGSDRKIAIF